MYNINVFIAGNSTVILADGLHITSHSYPFNVTEVSIIGGVADIYGE